MLGSQNRAEFHYAWKAFHMQNQDYSTKQVKCSTEHTLGNAALHIFFTRTGVKSSLS